MKWMVVIVLTSSVILGILTMGGEGRLLVNKKYQKCMESATGGDKDQVQLKPCSGDDSQDWNIVKAEEVMGSFNYKKIKNSKTGLCLHWANGKVFNRECAENEGRQIWKNAFPMLLTTGLTGCVYGYQENKDGKFYAGITHTCAQVEDAGDEFLWNEKTGCTRKFRQYKQNKSAL